MVNRVVTIGVLMLLLREIGVLWCQLLLSRSTLRNLEIW